jgi:hypothetical protein
MAELSGCAPTASSRMNRVIGLPHPRATGSTAGRYAQRQTAVREIRSSPLAFNFLLFDAGQPVHLRIY